MKLRVIALALFLKAALSIHAVHAKNATPEPELDSNSKIILQSIAARYEKLGNWTGTFVQNTFSTGLGKGTSSQGKFTYQAPNKFRYSIVSPDPSDFLSDGSSAWQIVYRNGRDKPADVKHFKSLKAIELDRYLILLKGLKITTPAAQKKLMADFVVTTRKTDAALELQLEPRKSAEISKVVLVFQNDVEAPARAVLEDAIGNETKITINSFEPRLKKIDPKLFQPDFPSGSKVEEF